MIDITEINLVINEFKPTLIIFTLLFFALIYFIDKLTDI